MPSVKRNLVANFLGRTWTSLVGLLFVPLYVRYLGIESYGLIGIFTSIQTILGLLDMGLSTTLNRELARHKSSGEDNQYIVNLVFTMERIYFIISSLACLTLIIGSLLFATRWVHTDRLDNQTITTAFILMAVNFAIQFPGSLYQGGLMGLQRQVSLNVIVGCVSTARAVGAVLILWLVSPTIYAFLLWQILMNAAQFFFLRKILQRHLPVASQKAHFDKTTIKKFGRYAAGIMGISALTIILTQSDKIILSSVLNLTEFGYYSLASVISGAFAMLLFPVTSAVFPRLTELVNNKDRQTELLALFHRASQLISVIVLPLGISLFVFSYDVILIWTRNVVIAENTSTILKYLVLGTTVNSLMTIPYQYTLSIGWLRYGINISIVAIIIFLPVIFFGAYRYGATGAAFVWMILNGTYFIFAMLYLFSKCLKEEKIKWYFIDVIRPMIVCVAFATPFFLAHRFLRFTTITSLLLLAGCMITCYLSTIWIGAPSLKNNILKQIVVFRTAKTKTGKMQNKFLA